MVMPAAWRDPQPPSAWVYEIDQHVGGHDAPEQLVEIADRLRATLIVIDLRRRTPTGKLLTGSQAQRILLDARWPVLAVNAPS
jgi:nucleotide-binding universal stress UspA family protein